MAWSRPSRSSARICGAASAWPEQPGAEVVQVARRSARRDAAGVVVQAVAGHGRLVSRAVTAVENWSQTARCSPSAAWPAAVRW